MHAHRYQDTKNCPRIKCQREETIEHVMWEWFFLQGRCGGEMQSRHDCIKRILYDDILYFRWGGDQTERKDPYSSIVGEIIFVEGPSTIDLGFI